MNLDEQSTINNHSRLVPSCTRMKAVCRLSCKASFMAKFSHGCASHEPFLASFGELTRTPAGQFGLAHFLSKGEADTHAIHQTMDACETSMGTP
jgi:hypothetical protein